MCCALAAVRPHGRGICVGLIVFCVLRKRSPGCSTRSGIKIMTETEHDETPRVPCRDGTGRVGHARRSPPVTVSDDDNGSNNALANNTLPNFVSGSVKTQTYDGSTDDLLTAGLGKTGLASATPPAIANAAAADGRRTAASRDLFELPRARRHVGERRLRALLGAERRPERQRHARRRQDRRQGIPRLRRRRQRHEERQPARADSGELQPGPAVHRHGDVVGIARRVRRDLGGGRVGPETRLRGRLHRQGQRQRRARTRDQPRHADRRHARGRERSPARGSIFTANLGSTSLSTFNTNFPNRYAFKHAHSQQNPEKDWGNEHAAGDPVRVLGAQRFVRPARRHHAQGPLQRRAA